MAKFITRDVAQAAKDIPWEDVPVDEWEPGAVIRMVGLNAKDASEYSKSLVQLDPKGNVRSIRMDGFLEDLVIKTACNENFEHIFTKEDKEWLGKKSAKVLKRLVDVAQRLSGMDDAVKNSEGIPGEETPSD